MSRKTGGTRGDVRQSALWGSGNRGDEFRPTPCGAARGRGLATFIGVVAFAVPLAATARLPGRAPRRTGRRRRLVRLPAAEGQGEGVPGRPRPGDRAGRPDLAGRREGCSQAGQVPARFGLINAFTDGVDRQGARQAGEDQGPRRHRGRAVKPSDLLVDSSGRTRTARRSSERPEGSGDRVRRLGHRHEQA